MIPHPLAVGRFIVSLKIKYIERYKQENCYQLGRTGTSFKEYNNLEDFLFSMVGVAIIKSRKVNSKILKSAGHVILNRKFDARSILLFGGRKMQRCIICKHNSDHSKSVEHIIPESLGNKDIILPKGVVCDKCNNYIARKIEQPFLNDPYIMGIRFGSKIISKKKRAPIIEGVHLDSLSHIGLSFDVNDHSINVCARKENEEKNWIHSILQKKSGTFIIPASQKADRYKTSRFLAKVALEALVKIVLEVPGGIDECIDKKELDELRRYIRRGGQKVWPYIERRIYSANKIFADDNEQYEILHEYMIFVTDIKEYYLIFCLNGIEYALNLGGPEVEGYENWLKQNNNISPLYMGDLEEKHQD